MYRHYHVIKSMIGYMPDNLPYVTTSFRDAHRAAVQEVRWEREGDNTRHWKRTNFQPKSGFASWLGERNYKYDLPIIVTIDPCYEDDCYEEYQKLAEKGYV